MSGLGDNVVVEEVQQKSGGQMGQPVTERTATVDLAWGLGGSLLGLGLSLPTGTAKRRHRHMSDCGHALSVDHLP